MRWFDKRMWSWALVSLVVGMIVLAMTGCKSKEYVTVPEYHTKYVTRTDTFAKTDSIYVKDSVYVYRNGDTVFVNKVAYRDRWHNIYKVKMDTIIKRDSIPYPVERQLTKNEQRLMDIGRAAIVWIICLALLILLAGLLIYKDHNSNKKC